VSRPHARFFLALVERADVDEVHVRSLSLFATAWTGAVYPALLWFNGVRWGKTGGR
jgi:hypothetical protein